MRTARPILRHTLTLAAAATLLAGLSGCGMFEDDDSLTTAERIQRHRELSGGNDATRSVEITGSTPGWSSGNSGWSAGGSGWSSGGQGWSNDPDFRPQSDSGFSPDSFGGYKLPDRGIYDE